MHLIFLGPPACGKGTQSAILGQKGAYYHLSTGDLIRNEIASQTDLGMKIKETINSGALCSSQIVNELVEKDVEKHQQVSILFDGYPRKLDQAIYLDFLLKDTKGEIKRVFYFDIEADELVQRVLGRITCKSCGAIYNLHSSPTKEEGVCDNCGSNEMLRRGDDNKDVLLKRIQSFYDETAPLKDFYQERGILTVVDARAPVEQVTKQILNAL